MRLLALWLLAFSVGCSADKPSPGASAGTGQPRPSAAASVATAPPATATPPATAAATSSAAPAGGPTPPQPLALGGVPLTVPASVKPGERRPFVLYLHGLGGSGAALLKALKVADLAGDLRFSYAAPDGSMGAKKQRYWNASPSCCNFDNVEVDHVSALRVLLQQAAAHPSVDPKKIFIVGYSNGGFMAHRLACEVDGIAAIASISGMGPNTPCKPPAPVAVLQVHGDIDDVIPYNGGFPLKKTDVPRHPSAKETVAAWATHNQCTAKDLAATSKLDFEERLAGDETQMALYAGCKRPVALWTVQKGDHYIGTNRKAQEAIYNFLEKNAR